MTRSPIIAALLSLAMAGAGHLYLGRAARFLLPAGALLLTYLALGIAGVLSTFMGMAIYLVLLILLWGFGVVDSIVIACREHSRIPKWYSHWYVYLSWPLVYIAYFLIMISIREPLLGYSSFRIATRAMSPALEPRDVVLADTRAFSDSAPEIGDLIVIRKLGGDRSYIRRVSARPSEDTVVATADHIAGVPAEVRTLNVPLSAVVGRITYYMYSQDRDRIGQRVR